MSRIAVVLLAVVTAACANAPVRPAARPVAASVPAFSFADDTFAFRNDIRAHHADTDDLYANYCFVLARGMRQFHQFARFEPAAPRVDADEYTRRVRAVTSHAAWAPPLPPAERVVIPGFANLRAFSAAEEAAVKAGLGSRFWTFVHWTNWRVTMPVPDGHQAVVLDEVLAELAAGRLVQLLVTNWPKQELNHTVVAYGYRGVDDGVAAVRAPACGGGAGGHRLAAVPGRARRRATQPRAHPAGGAGARARRARGRGLPPLRHLLRRPDHDQSPRRPRGAGGGHRGDGGAREGRGRRPRARRADRAPRQLGAGRPDARAGRRAPDARRRRRRGRSRRRALPARRRGAGALRHAHGPDRVALAGGRAAARRDRRAPGRSRARHAR